MGPPASQFPRNSHSPSPASSVSPCRRRHAITSHLFPVRWSALESRVVITPLFLFLPHLDPRSRATKARHQGHTMHLVRVCPDCRRPNPPPPIPDSNRTLSFINSNPILYSTANALSHHRHLLPTKTARQAASTLAIIVPWFQTLRIGRYLVQEKTIAFPVARQLSQLKLTTVSRALCCYREIIGSIIHLPELAARAHPDTAQGWDAAYCPKMIARG